MAPWSIIIDALQYFGITPDKFGPFFLFSLLAIWYFSYKLSPINRSLKRIGNAIIEIQTFLKGQGMRIDHTLIESPGSPLRPILRAARLWLRDDFLGQSRMVGKEDNDE